MIGCFVPCHRCIDNAIHSAAGVQLRNECNHIMNQRRIRFGRQYEEPTGTATLTSAYNLPCKYVIHTVGPIVYGRLTEALKEDLRNCYRNVLQCCMEHEINSVAFCCISTGEFHFPNDIAAQIAVETTEQFFAQNENCGIERVIFNVFKDIDLELYKKYVCMENLYS
jgi:O-acetyl-ADP-ribose deacetylase (regulator of RNase III)